MELLTDEQAEYLRSVNFEHSSLEVAELLNEKFGLYLKASQVKAYRQNHKLPPCGLTGRFKKGDVPWTAGKKFPGKSSNTSFSKGNRPHNTDSIGTRIKRYDAGSVTAGYVWEKIAEPNIWKQVHYLVWEKANGEVPPNSAIIFADQNRDNFSLDNLILVSRSELLVANRRGLLHKNASLTKSGVLIAKLISKVGRLNKKRKGRKKQC